jgi:hypothetical protein
MESSHDEIKKLRQIEEARAIIAIPLHPYFNLEQNPFPRVENPNPQCISPLSERPYCNHT